MKKRLVFHRALVPTLFALRFGVEEELAGGAASEITAPRTGVYPAFGQDHEGPITHAFGMCATGCRVPGGYEITIPGLPY